MRAQGVSADGQPRRAPKNRESATVAEKATPTEWPPESPSPSFGLPVISRKAKAVSGALVSVTGTTLLILGEGAGQQPFEKAQIASVSVKKQGHRLRNTLIGMAVGLGIGLATGGKYSDESRPATDGSYAVLGAGVGALWRTGGWGKVYQPLVSY